MLALPSWRLSVDFFSWVFGISGSWGCAMSHRSGTNEVQLRLEQSKLPHGLSGAANKVSLSAKCDGSFTPLWAEPRLIHFIQTTENTLEINGFELLLTQVTFLGWISSSLLEVEESLTHFQSPKQYSSLNKMWMQCPITNPPGLWRPIQGSELRRRAWHKNLGPFRTVVFKWFGCIPLYLPNCAAPSPTCNMSLPARFLVLTLVPMHRNTITHHVLTNQKLHHLY